MQSVSQSVIDKDVMRSVSNFEAYILFMQADLACMRLYKSLSISDIGILAYTYDWERLGPMSESIWTKPSGHSSCWSSRISTLSAAVTSHSGRYLH